MASPIKTPLEAPPITDLRLPLIQAAGGTCFVLGSVGFVTSILPPNALTYLAFMLGGVVIVASCLWLQIHEHGLLRHLSPGLRKLLLETTLLEWCKDPTVGQKVVAFCKEVFPIFLCHSDAEEAEALANMSAAYRRNLTTKGLVGLMNPSIQRLILPRELYAARERESRERVQAETDASAAAAAVHSDTALSTASPTPSVLGARLDLQSALVARLLRVRRLKFALRLLPAAKLRQAAVAAASVVALQLFLSGRARRMFSGALRATALGGACTAAGLSLGLLGLRFATEQQARATHSGVSNSASVFRTLAARYGRGESFTMERWWSQRTNGERQLAVASASALVALAAMRTLKRMARR